MFQLIELSTLSSHELLAFIFVSCGFRSHNSNNQDWTKHAYFLRRFTAKNLNLMIIILFPLKKYIYIYSGLKFEEIHNSKQCHNICEDLPNSNIRRVFKVCNSAILPSSSLTLPCYSVGRIWCCVKRTPLADMSSRR